MKPTEKNESDNSLQYGYKNQLIDSYQGSQ